MQNSHLAYLARGHFAGLDGLRCLAILPVIAHHATPRPPSGIWGKGAVGVDLFFVLSGFLITTLLLRERRATGGVDLGRFYVRRAWRIFPLYYAMLGLYLVFAAFHPRGHPESAHLLGNWHWHASYTANWFVDYAVPHPVPFAFSWSLCVEEQFYLAWPLLVAWLPQRWMLVTCMAAAVAFDHWVLVRLGLAPEARLTRILGSFSTAIGVGALLALALDDGPSFAILRRPLALRSAPLLSLCAVLGLLALPATPYLGLCLALACLVGSVAVSGGGLLGPLLEQPLVRWGGRLSYAAYLTHVTALALVRRAFPEQAGSFAFVFCVGLPLCIVLAWLAHVGIERPGLRLRDRGAGQRTLARASRPSPADRIGSG